MAGIGAHATWILARVCFRLTTFWMSYKIPACLFLLMRWQDKSASVPAVATGDPTMALLWKGECEHRKLSKSEGSVGWKAGSLGRRKLSLPCWEEGEIGKHPDM